MSNNNKVIDSPLFVSLSGFKSTPTEMEGGRKGKRTRYSRSPLLN